MTKTEFERWWSDITLRFPSIESWLTRNHGDELSERTLLKTWLDVMHDVDLTNALEVNRKMQSGDFDFVADFHEQDIPRHVRRLAKQIAWQNVRGSEQRELPPLGNKGTGFPAKAILQRWRELESDGMPREQAREQALAEFPVGNSQWREHRYSCLACLDSGRVHVASNAAIEAILRDDFEQCHHRDGVARCSCEKGQRMVRKAQGRELPIVVFNSTLDFAIRDPLWGQDERDRFSAWCYGQRDSRAEAMAKTHANYDPAFAEFGR